MDDERCVGAWTDLCILRVFGVVRVVVAFVCVRCACDPKAAATESGWVVVNVCVCLCASFSRCMMNHNHKQTNKKNHIGKQKQKTGHTKVGKRATNISFERAWDFSVWPI